MFEDFLVIPKCITKKKVRTREIPLSPQLKHELAVWKTTWPEVYKRTPDASDYLFPTGGDISKPLLSRAADRLLRAAVVGALAECAHACESGRMARLLCRVLSRA